MIYTVTFNPALDYVLEVDSLDSEDICRAQGENIFFGGKGINVSVILSRLGIENKAMGFLAGFSGKYLEKLLEGEGVDTDFIYLEDGFTRINVKIKSDRELDINAKGAKISENKISELINKLDALGSGDYLVLAGSVPFGMPDDTYAKILSPLADRGIRFVVDATGDLLMNCLKHKPFLIKPNHHELGELFNVNLSGADFDEIAFYARRLREQGASNVLVSCGKMGAVLVDENDNVYEIGNVDGKIVSSVGCGDSMVAGFIAGCVTGNDYGYALRLAGACGNASAFSTSLATEEEILKMSDIVKEIKR